MPLFTAGPTYAVNNVLPSDACRHSSALGARRSWPRQRCDRIEHLSRRPDGDKTAHEAVTLPGKATRRRTGAAPIGLSPPNGTVDQLADEVRVPIVPRILLDHVRVNPAQ